MFLTAGNLSIKDFLKNIGFVVPQGYTLDYIVTPGSSNPGENVESFDDNFQTEKPDNVDATYTYAKRDLSGLQSFSNSQLDLSQIPNAFPRKTQPVNADNLQQMQQQVISNGTEIKSPEVKLKVIESTDNNSKLAIQLTESVGVLPKNTIVRVYKESINKKKEILDTKQDNNKKKVEKENKYVPTTKYNYATPENLIQREEIYPTLNDQNSLDVIKHRNEKGERVIDEKQY